MLRGCSVVAPVNKVDRGAATSSITLTADVHVGLHVCKSTCSIACRLCLHTWPRLAAAGTPSAAGHTAPLGCTPRHSSASCCCCSRAWRSSSSSTAGRSAARGPPILPAVLLPPPEVWLWPALPLELPRSAAPPLWLAASALPDMFAWVRFAALCPTHLPASTAAAAAEEPGTAAVVAAVVRATSLGACGVPLLRAPPLPPPTAGWVLHVPPPA